MPESQLRFNYLGVAQVLQGDTLPLRGKAQIGTRGEGKGRLIIVEV
jgi:hypothetical protein